MRRYQVGGFLISENHPVAALHLQQAEARALTELGDVPPWSQVERRLPAELDEMLVATAVDPLVRRHADKHDLIDLNGREDRHPQQVEPRVEHHPRHPRRAALDGQDPVPHAVAQRQVANVLVEHHAAVEQQQHHREDEGEKRHEDLVVADTHVVPDPRAVMVELLRWKKIINFRLEQF